MQMTKSISAAKFIFLGAILATTLPPFGITPFITLFVFFPFLKELSTNTSRERIFTGFCFGFGYFIVLLKWISIVGNDALIALSAICAVWWAIASSLSLVFKESKMWPFWFAISWTGLELIRDRFPWGGFGWGQLGIAWVQTPLSGLYSIFGQVGMTFATYLTLASIYRLKSVWGNRSLTKNLAVVFVGLLATFSLSSISNSIQPITRNENNLIRVSAVQGGVEHTGLGVLGQPRAVLNKHFDETLRNIEVVNNSDLLIWPESSVDLDPYQDFVSMQTLKRLGDLVSAPLLVNGTVISQSLQKQNSSLLISNDSIEKVYQKRRLVPFGEFLPLRKVIEQYTDRASMLSTDYESGLNPGSITVKRINLSILICFEIADDSMIHQDISNKSAVIVQTNNATYQNLGQTEQQVLYTRLRAIETARPIVSISTSGNSVIVNSVGQVLTQLNQDETGILNVNLVEIEGQTIASKIHDWLVAVIFVAFTSGISLILIKRLKIKS